jgi:thioredoxin-related protein
MSRNLPIALTVAALAAVTAGKAGAAQLIMFERAGCSWCARFDAEVAPLYMKTDAGRTAPWRRVNRDQALPADLASIDPGAFTPTFVLVDQGHEIGRIRGYPGDAFFFGLLDRMLATTAPWQPRS